MPDETLPVATPETDCWTPQQPKSPGATEAQPDDQGVPSNRGEGFASFGALLSAFIASSWCWLPPLLILGGISGAGMTTAIEQFRPLFMVVTFGFLGAAFYLTYRPRPGASRGGRPSRIMTMNKVMLWGVTVIAVAFLFFPQTLSGLFESDGGFTADMDRTVIAIEGMT